MELTPPHVVPCITVLPVLPARDELAAPVGPTHGQFARGGLGTEGSKLWIATVDPVLMFVCIYINKYIYIIIYTYVYIYMCIYVYYIIYMYITLYYILTQVTSILQVLAVSMVVRLNAKLTYHM